MDWTIVVSVLAALLLWPVVLGSVVALGFLPVAAVFRGRIHRLMEQKMAHCREILSSWSPADADGTSGASAACACAPSEGGEDSA